MQPASGTTVVRVSRSEARQPETQPAAGPNASATRPLDLPESQPTSAPAMSPTAAVTAITKARCERELECRNIGLGRKFNAIENCMAEVGVDTRDEVGAEQCRAGHEPTRLDQCLREIMSADCSVPVDSLSRLLACPRSALCR